MKMRRIIILCLSLLLLTSMPVFAEVESATGGFATIKMIFKLIVYLVIFIVITLLALYGTKFLAKNFSGLASSKYIKVVDTISISANIRIIIVEINSLIYILAMNNESIELMDKYSVDEFKAENNNINDYNNQFKDNHLMKMLKKFIDKEDENEKKY